MKARIILVCSTLALAGVALTAQQADTIEITGCLSTWDDAMAADPDRASSGAPAAGTAAGTARGTDTDDPEGLTRYVLVARVETRDGSGLSQGSSGGTGAQTAPGSQVGAGASQGAQQPTAQRPRQQVFAVRPADADIDLQSHVGHTVTMTGTLDKVTHQAPQAASTGTSGSTGTATPGRDDIAMRMAMPALLVRTLTMVAATCS